MVVVSGGSRLGIRNLARISCQRITFDIRTSCGILFRPRCSIFTHCAYRDRCLLGPPVGRHSTAGTKSVGPGTRDLLYYSESRNYQLDKLPDDKLYYCHPSHLDKLYQQVRVRTNALGLRNDPIRDKTPNEFRILFVGDSVTFGWGY